MKMKIMELQAMASDFDPKNPMQSMAKELLGLRIKDYKAGHAFPHWCDINHSRIGFSGDDGVCPLCKVLNAVCDLTETIEKL